jgi:hypothetical protein
VSSSEQLRDLSNVVARDFATLGLPSELLPVFGEPTVRDRWASAAVIRALADGQFEIYNVERDTSSEFSGPLSAVETRRRILMDRLTPMLTQACRIRNVDRDKFVAAIVTGVISSS